jgi:hypothetical protein
MNFVNAPVPARSLEVFKSGIRHPDLWLWDSWVLKRSPSEWVLYCLALAKLDASGRPILPSRRNEYTFHIRAFATPDAGASWRDLGAVLTHGQVSDGADSRNIWSGSILPLAGQSVAFGYTGVRDCGRDRQYLQSICVGLGSSPLSLDKIPRSSLSCPLRDYDDIISKGYYLGPRDALGHNNGEAGGPIMAWRDPFLFRSSDGELQAVWSAKLDARVPAIAHARLAIKGEDVLLSRLEEPIELPDAELMTQAEVPKIYHNPSDDDWWMLISACDRQYEGQPTHQVSHLHRLYRAKRPQGPWRVFDPSGSAVTGLDGLFGASIVEFNPEFSQIGFLGPYTENAGPERQLSFASLVQIAGASASPRLVQNIECDR